MAVRLCENVVFFLILDNAPENLNFLFLYRLWKTQDQNPPEPPSGEIRPLTCMEKKWKSPLQKKKSTFSS